MDFALSATAEDLCSRMREEVFSAEAAWASYLLEHGEHAPRR